MKPLPILLVFTFAACLANAPAHPTTGPNPTPNPSASPTPSDRTVEGQFRSSDGSSGTFVETFTVADTTLKDVIVYTLKDSTRTRTETLTSTLNSDGTKTITYSDLGFGATLAFTSTTDFAASKGGCAVGTGTFTAADGTTGVLAVVVAKNRQTSITSTDFTSATGVLTRQVRLEEKGDGGDTIRTLDVDATGALTTTTLTRFGGMHHQHP